MKLIEYQAPTFTNRIAHNRRIRQMAADVLPQDKSWQVILLFVALWGGIAVMFVRWWLCV